MTNSETCFCQVEEVWKREVVIILSMSVKDGQELVTTVNCGVPSAAEGDHGHSVDVQVTLLFSLRFTDHIHGQGLCQSQVLRVVRSCVVRRTTRP